MIKNFKTRVLAIILMVSLFVGITPFTPAGQMVYASEWWPGFDFSTDEHYNDNYEGDHDEEEKDSHVRINPLYKDVIDTEDIYNYENGIVFDYIIFIPGFTPSRVVATTSYSGSTYADSVSAAGDKLRSGMVARSATPVVYYKMDLTFDREEIIEAVDDIFSSAVRHTGKPKEGDYLNFVWKSWGSNISAMSDGKDLYLEIRYNVKYYTTASQESTLDSKIESLKNELDVDDKSDYAKIKAIYDYVCKNVSYDYENLYDDSHYLKYTAYAGLVNKTCVCQGYATLMYRLALEYGIDSRVIAGKADGKDHAWNIVALDGKYYYLDATWDAERSSHEFFLKGDNDWTHEAASRYQTGSFKSNYPTASSNYAPVSLSAPKIELSNVESSGKPKITWGAVNGATKYYVYRATSEDGSFSYIGTTYNTEYINTSAEAGKKYYYKVKSADNSDNVSSYSKSKYITCDLPQPTGLGATTVASSGKPKITWNSVSGADKYYIYRATSSGGTYSYLGSTSNTNYTNTGAEVGTCYYYKVKAVYSSNENANSAESSYTYVTCDLPQPTNVKVNNVESSGKPKITWGAVSKADKYYVYRATSSDGTYSYLGSTTNSNYTNTGAVAGTCYYYKVKAVYTDNENANSALSSYSYVTCDLAQPTNVKVTNVESSGKPKISWSAVDGADKYYVYRSTSSTGTYDYLGSTTNTHYTNTGAVVGTCYYYKVKAVYTANEYANSTQSSYCYITCDLPQPTNVKVNNVESSGKPKITWTAVDGANKYYVYRATSSTGTYDYLGSTTNTYYTNTGAVAGNTYYYKVKAVYTSNENANSAQSNSCYVTCDLAQPVVSIELASSGKPKVSWKTVEGASEYQVYRKVGEAGTYSKYYTTTSTSMINTSAEAGVKYYYKVIAVCPTTTYGNSAYSDEVYIVSK